MNAAKVETYELHLNGHYIRKATKVTIGQKIVEFTELMSKKSAVAQAERLIKKGF